MDLMVIPSVNLKENERKTTNIIGIDTSIDITNEVQRESNSEVNNNVPTTIDWLSTFIFMCILSIIIGLINSSLVKISLTPFICDDSSLSYEFLPSSIPFYLVYVVGIFVNIVSMGIFFLVKKFLSLKTYNCSSPTRTLPCEWAFLFYGINFTIGALATELITDLLKIFTSRPRPFFFDVCRPSYNSSCTRKHPYVSSLFIKSYECLGNPSLSGSSASISNSLKSFPSGHSSMAMFMAFYSIVTLQNSRKCKKNGIFELFDILRILFQIILFLCACFVAVSRFHDHHHHFDDIIFGSFIGISVAFLIQKVHLKKFNYFFT